MRSGRRSAASSCPACDPVAATARPRQPARGHMAGRRERHGSTLTGRKRWANRPPPTCRDRRRDASAGQCQHRGCTMSAATPSPSFTPPRTARHVLWVAEAALGRLRKTVPSGGLVDEGDGFVFLLEDQGEVESIAAELTSGSAWRRWLGRRDATSSKRSPTPGGKGDRNSAAARTERRAWPPLPRRPPSFRTRSRARKPESNSSPTKH